MRTWLEGEGTENSQGEGGGTVDTVLDPESLLRQIDDLRAMLDKANKTIRNQWGIIYEKSWTFKDSSKLWELERRQNRLKGVEAYALRKEMRRMGRRALDLGR